jgi:hypothetical protein
MRLTKSFIIALLLVAPALLSAQTTATVARYGIGKKVSIIQGTSANVVVFDTKLFDVASFVPAGSDPSNYTAPKAGYYRIYVSVTANAAGGGMFNPGYAFSLHLYKAGTDAGSLAAFYAGDKMSQGVASGETIVNLTQGQQFDIRLNAAKEGTDAAPVNIELAGNPNNPSSSICIEYLGQ